MTYTAIFCINGNNSLLQRQQPKPSFTTCFIAFAARRGTALSDVTCCLHNGGKNTKYHVKRRITQLRFSRLLNRYLASYPCNDTEFNLLSVLLNSQIYVIESIQFQPVKHKNRTFSPLYSATALWAFKLKVILVQR